MYTVSDIKKITGISARTLQYYDEISLLKPTSLTAANYRLYDDSTLKLLQQILFFKELGFKLSEIKEIINSPQFDKKEVYKRQRELLLLKRNRIDGLINLLIKLENGEECMDFKEFDLSEYISELEKFKEGNVDVIIKYWGTMQNYEAFVEKVKKDEETVAKLAIKMYGSIEKYTEEMKKNLENFSEIMEAKITPEVEAEMDRVAKERDYIFRRLVQDTSADYTSDVIQTVVEELLGFISENSELKNSIETANDLIATYKSEYIAKIIDVEYGNNALEYAIKALEFYISQN